MLTLALPLGNSFGWGVCGKYLALALARTGPVQLLTPPFDLPAIGDELEYSELRRIAADMTEFRYDEARGYPSLQTIVGHSLMPMVPELRGRRSVGYTAFEISKLPRQSIDNARRHFDRVVATSTWCRDVLREHGMASAEVVLQGVDQAFFNTFENQKAFFQNRFVVFSGGKFEFRKGQDLVIRAFRVLQERHEDVFLVNAWFNHWEGTVRSMAMSPHIEFVAPVSDHFAFINRLLQANRVDLDKVLTLGGRPQTAMARIYKNSDCGLFPNRCEAGSNLVLMEYMACGKPAIVSNSSGHRDVANDGNALMLNNLRPLTITFGGELETVWDEPSLDEMIDALEWAYQHREALQDIGAAAGASMQEFTWPGAAARLRHYLEEG